MKSEIIAPGRTREQRLTALQHANRVRSFRAQMKRSIRAGERDAREDLRNPPQEAETMKVVDLLVAVPKVGRVKANRALAQARVSPSKTLAGISDRQREELLAKLPGAR